MTRLLTRTGLAVLLLVVLPAGAWLTVVAVAGEQPFRDERARVPSAAGARIDVDDAPLTLTASPDAAVHVTTTGTISLTDPSVEALPDAAGALDVAVAGCARCHLAVRVAVPPGVPVAVSGAPDAVTALGVAGPLRATVGSGSVTGRDLDGPVEIDAGSASVDLGFRRPSPVTVTAGAGDVSVTEPREGAYRTDPQTGRGTVVDTLPGAGGPATPVLVRSGRGNLLLLAAP